MNELKYYRRMLLKGLFLAQPCHSCTTILPLTYLISQNITTNPIANFATPPTHPITHKKSGALTPPISSIPYTYL